MGPKVRTGLISVALLLCIGLVAWIVLGRSSAPSAKDLGFDLTDSRHVSLDFEVTKEDRDEAVCAVKAQAEDHGIVGWKEVTVPRGAAPGGGKTSHHHTVLRVTGKATTVTVDSCWSR